MNQSKSAPMESLMTTRVYPKFGLHSRNVLRVPKLRKNPRLKSRWGLKYHTAIHNAVFRKHCLPYMPTEPPAYLSEEIVESDPLYVCKHCKDCFRFQSSFEDHYNRHSWILGLWCHHCFITVCTHSTADFQCWTCTKKNNEKRAYLRSRGLTRTQKLGATKIFYNQCQLFQHMKMHGITLVDLGSLMLMPIPADMSDSDWTPKLEIACEALMEHTFILRMHIMDWLNLYNVDDKWWKLINDEGNYNVISKIVNGYQGREVFKRIEKSTADQFMDFDSPDSDSKNSADEFDDTNFKSTNGDPVNVSDKNVTENEDNPCMSNDITFVDCGSTPHYFEPELSVEPEAPLESESIQSELPEQPEASHVACKKHLTDVKKSQDIASRHPVGKVKMNNKKKTLPHLGLRGTNAMHENVTAKDSNVKQSFKSNAQQHKVQSVPTKTVGNSEVEANEILDNPVKIDVPSFSYENHVLPKLNLHREESQQSLVTNNSSNKFNKVPSPSDTDVTWRPSELPSRLVSGKKLVLVGQNSRDTIACSENIERLGNSVLGNMDGDALSEIRCNSSMPKCNSNAKKKQITGKILLRNGKKYLIKSAKNITESASASILRNATLNTSISLNSNEPEIVDVEQTASLHGDVSYLTPSSSTLESFSKSNESSRKTLVTSKLRKVPSHLIAPAFARKNFFEVISLVEQEDGDLYMDIKIIDHNVKSLSRNMCDTMFKFRQEMIIEFQHLNGTELKKRIDHLQQASEETKKVLDFVPSNILNEKLRAISTLQRILDEHFQKRDQSVKDDKNDDAVLNEWESDFEDRKKTNLCKCPTCDKLMKPKSYNIGFSKLSKNDDVYCTCYKFVCHECLSCQGNLIQFVAHQNFHKKKKPYVCPDCRLKFISDKSLEAHMWTVCFHMLKKRVFACKICEIDGFRDMESVIRHFVVMHSDTKVACEDCFKVFFSYGEYKKHHAQMHSSVTEENSIVRLVTCKLTGIITRYENYISHLEEFQGIRKLTWFKCPFCPLIAVENKHIRSVFNTHLRNVHLHCLPVLISQEALTLIFGTKHADVFARTNETKRENKLTGAVVPKIVNTETITSETFERGSQNSCDIESANTDESVKNVDSQTTEKVDNEKVKTSKILNARSVTDHVKRSESKKATGKIRTKDESRNSTNQNEVTKDENLLRERNAKETIESDNDKSNVKKGVQTTKVESNNESVAVCVPKSEKSKSTETNDVRVNSPLESSSSKSVSNSNCVPKTNVDGRIKVVDIRKICKPDIKSLVVTELHGDSRTKDGNGSLPASIPKPPPLARIPQYLLKSWKAEDPVLDGSRNIASSSDLGNDKVKKHIAIHGPTEIHGKGIDYLCHLCDERINTSWPVMRMHFRQKHSEYKLMTITPRLQRISSDFIDGGYKQHLIGKKRKSDSALPVSKKKRRWTPKKYVDLSAPVGLCVEQETAEDGEGNFKCKRCDQRCNDMSSLREHIAVNHRLKGRYLVCLECGENFVVAPSLQMHLKAFHGIDDPIVYMNQNPSYAPDIDGDSKAEGKTTVANQCHVCMAVFEDKAAVDKHLRVHGMAFLNRKRIEARNAQKTPEKNANNATEENKSNIVKDDPKETVKRDRPAEAILEKLNVS